MERKGEPGGFAWRGDASGVRDEDRDQSGNEAVGFEAAVVYFVLTEPYVHSSESDGSNKLIHPGEALLGAQALVMPGSGIRPTVAVSHVRRVYASPASELWSGTFRESATLLLSNDRGAASATQISL